jgi:flagellar biosynthetic protein FliR
MAGSLVESLLGRVDLFLLILMRTTGLFVTAPIWSNRAIPVQLRIALAAGTALVLTPLIAEVPAVGSLTALVPLAMREVLVGMVIGFVAVLAFTAIQFAGELLDVSMGLSMINLLDPFTNVQMPILANFLHLLGMLIFFMIGGHHLLLKAMVDSYSIVPVGTAVLTEGLAQQIIAMGGALFVLGLKVASPVIAAIFLTTVALGILNRAVSQMNVFVVGLPVQLGVGLFLLVVTLPLYLSFLQVLFSGLNEQIYAALRLLKGE